MMRGLGEGRESASLSRQERKEGNQCVKRRDATLREHEETHEIKSDILKVGVTATTTRQWKTWRPL